MTKELCTLLLPSITVVKKLQVNVFTVKSHLTPGPTLYCMGVIFLTQFGILLYYSAAEEQDTLLASCQSSSVSSSGGPTKKRKTPACSKCGKPVKGHHRENNVLICSPCTSQENE